MSVVTLLEGTSLKRDEWISRLEISTDDITCLISSKILRQQEEGIYSLTFVGMVVFKNRLLVAQPKFGDARPLDLSAMLRILRSYFSRSAARRPVADKIRDPEYGNSEVLREFDALQQLREWFISHGLYRREQAQQSDRGRPHWGRTMAKRSPVIIQGAAIYPTMITERREGLLNDISALQISVLKNLLQRYGFPVPSDILHAEQATATSFPGWPLPESIRTYFLRRLAIEQRSIYRTDILQLLRLLKEVLDSRLAGAASQPQIYGTTAFYAVWEDACRTATAGYALTDPDAVLGRPVWWVRTPNGEKVQHRLTLIPDVVLIRDTWHLILDAKYYYRFPDARPGAPDVVKQLYYMESLTTPQPNVLSVFVLPWPGATEPTFLGYATIEGAHRKFAKIEAWGVDPQNLLSEYPSSSPHRANAFVLPILTQRNRVTELVGQAPMSIGS